MRLLLATGVAITLLGILALQTAFPAMVAGEHELAYDSGTPGASVSLPYVPHTWAGGDEEVNEQYEWIGNSMLAVRFTPDNSTIQMLLGVRFYITGDLASFNVWLFDSGRDFLTYGRAFNAAGSQVVTRVYSWTVTPVSIGWVNLNVSDRTYPIFLPGDFYVAVEFTTAQKPTLGLDTLGAKSNRSWFVDNQSAIGWVAYSSYAKQHGLPDGNLMIRADISPLYTLGHWTNATTSSAQSQVFPLGIIMPAGTVLAVLAVAAVGVWQVGKRRHVK